MGPAAGILHSLPHHHGRTHHLPSDLHGGSAADLLPLPAQPGPCCCHRGRHHAAPGTGQLLAFVILLSLIESAGSIRQSNLLTKKVCNTSRTLVTVLAAAQKCHCVSLALLCDQQLAGWHLLPHSCRAGNVLASTLFRVSACFCIVMAMSFVRHERVFLGFLCAQIRGIEEVSAVSVVGTLGMLVALAIAAIKICVTPHVHSYRHVCCPHRYSVRIVTDVPPVVSYICHAKGLPSREHASCYGFLSSSYWCSDTVRHPPFQVCPPNSTFISTSEGAFLVACRPPEIIHRPEDVSTPFVAIFDAVFTFGGQVNWMRCVPSTPDPSKFQDFSNLIQATIMLLAIPLRAWGQQPTNQPVTIEIFALKRFVCGFAKKICTNLPW